MKDEINVKIGEWIKMKREDAHLTQQEVGDKLGVSKTAIHYWETAKRVMYAWQLFDICTAIGADPSDLQRYLEE